MNVVSILTADLIPVSATNILTQTKLQQEFQSFTYIETCCLQGTAGHMKPWIPNMASHCIYVAQDKTWMDICLLSWNTLITSDD